MAGQEYVKIEAGFPYSDAGATASDTLEGPYKNCNEVTDDDKIIVGSNSKPITRRQNCLATSGNSVNQYKEYKDMTSCAAIFASSPQGANSGPYIITVETEARAPDHIQFAQKQVLCDMDDESNIPTYY